MILLLSASMYFCYHDDEDYDLREDMLQDYGERLSSVEDSDSQLKLVGMKKTISKSDEELRQEELSNYKISTRCTTDNAKPSDNSKLEEEGSEAPLQNPDEQDNVETETKVYDPPKSPEPPNHFVDDI